MEQKRSNTLHPIMLSLKRDIGFFIVGLTIVYFIVSFGILLCFMAVSPFWMFRPDVKNFNRGIIHSTARVLSVILLLVIS